jgi:hypothetical protein
MNFSQDESMSYTQMLLGHERTPDYYNDFIQGPMGAEVYKMFLWGCVWTISLYSVHLIAMLCF